MAVMVILRVNDRFWLPTSPPVGASVLVTACLLYQDLKWSLILQPSASPANIPLLGFTPGTETGTGTAEKVLSTALPSATQNVVKQTVKLGMELRA